MNRRNTFTLPLKPVVGERFQPTGFPNLGAALFERFDPESGAEVSCLHVESPQSMANRFEATTWNEAEQRPVDECAGIPYVEVVDTNGEFLTSSRLEAHRLASAYVMDAQLDNQMFETLLAPRLGLAAGKPVNHREIARAIFDLDPLSLVHGVFFARKNWPQQPKIARALTSFIDADDVRVAASGGIKTDSVNTRSDASVGRGAETGYGMVPHLRTEYTARSITAYVNVDLEQLRSYGLGAERTALLEALVWFELTQFFSGEGMRLRTACDLRATDMSNLKKTDEQATAELAAAVSALQGDLAEKTVVVWSGPAGKGKKDAS